MLAGRPGRGAGRAGGDPGRPPAAPGPALSDDLVWYAAYGSNTSAARFGCYLAGGRPDRALRTYPGCRDPSPPLASIALTVPGAVVFAGTSTVWGGGMAFLDVGAPGTSPARGWLITVAQFADLAAQEMHRPPGAVDPAAVLPDDPSGTRRLGPGRYETVLGLGTLDGVRLVTLTCAEPPPTPGLPLTAPSEPYLAVIAGGLREVAGLRAQP